jgi:hypothetical protein
VKYPDPRAHFALGTSSDQARDVEEGFIRELLSILNETRSPDAFLVTLSILQELKPDARAVVPEIIRNAERLRLFKRTDPDHPTEAQKMIVDCIGELLKKDRGPAAEIIPPPFGPNLFGAAAGALIGGAMRQPGSFRATALEGERPAQDPLLGAPGGETKPAGVDVSPGRVKPRPGVVK